MKRKVISVSSALILTFSIFCILSPSTAVGQPPTKQQAARARKFAQEGDSFFKQKDYASAIDRYQKAINVVPNYTAAYFFKGYAHYKLSQNEEAFQAFTKALELGYSPIEVYKVRWYLFYLRKDLDGALADLQEGIKIQPENSALLISAGDIYREKKMDREALTVYEKAAEFEPNNADLQYFIAFSYARLGDFVQQGAAALKAVQKGTKFPGDAWYLIGNSLQLQKKYSESIDAYERAVSAKPGVANGFNNLSHVYYLLSRYDEAISAAKRGLEVNPNSGNLYISLSWYYSFSDRSEEAVTAGKMAISLLPQESMAYTNLCRAYNDTKQYDLALQTCKTALKLNPGDAETSLYIARSYDLLKKGDIATEFYNKAVGGLAVYTKNNPDEPDGYYLLANAYFAVGQRSDAIAAYKQCLSLSPKFIKAIYNLGQLYVLAGNKSAARGQYNELLKLDSVKAAQLLKAIDAK